MGCNGFALKSPFAPKVPNLPQKSGRLRTKQTIQCCFERRVRFETCSLDLGNSRGSEFRHGVNTEEMFIGKFYAEFNYPLHHAGVTPPHLLVRDFLWDRVV